MVDSSRLTPSLPTIFAFWESGGEGVGGGRGGTAICFHKQSQKMVKLTKIAAFEKFVSPKNSREAGIQAGSRTASYNQMESTLPIASYDVL